MKLHYNDKNIAVSCVVIGLFYMALGPAETVQNIALVESSDIELKVGYYSEIVKYVGAILAGFVVHPLYKWAGIKVTAIVMTLLGTGLYWAMIWIVNAYVIYLGAFLTGVGSGAMWIIWPMVIIDNSDSSRAQRNMGIWWVFVSLGIFLGGLSNFFYFEKVSEISKTNRVMVYSICTGVTVLAALVGGLGINISRDGLGRGREFTDLGNPKGRDGAAAVWFKRMSKLPEFWLSFVPLIYWGFMWGFVIKILPTATASISNERNLIPLCTLSLGASCLVGSTVWTYISKFLNNTICTIIASCLAIVAIVLSVLIFPKGAAAAILDVNTIDTYIEPHPTYIVVISALIGLADSGISIIYFSVVGRIYGAGGTSLGYSINNVGFDVFYIMSMFAPSLFDLHSYCFTVIGTVLVMCVTLTVFLKAYLSGEEEAPQRLECEEMDSMRELE